MKKASLFVLFLSLFFVCFSQNSSETQVVIQQKDGKVFFSDTIRTNLSKTEMQAHMATWLNDVFLPNRGTIASNDVSVGLMTCQVTDYVEIEKKAFSIFALYMPYILAFQFEDNLCTVLVRNINYMELDVAESGEEYSRDDLIPGERVLLEQKYRRTFTKDASQRLTQHTLARISEVFNLIRGALDADK